MKIFIQDSKGTKEPFDIDENDFVLTLRNKAINRLRIKNDIQFLFNGSILEDNEALSTYDVEEGAIIIYCGAFIAGILY
jgi:hypothetical protein